MITKDFMSNSNGSLDYCKWLWNEVNITSFLGDDNVPNCVTDEESLWIFHIYHLVWSKILVKDKIPSGFCEKSATLK